MISYASVSIDEGHINLEIEKVSKYDRTPELDGCVETFDVDATAMFSKLGVEAQQGDIFSVIIDECNLLGILKKEDDEKNRRVDIIRQLLKK